MKRVFLEHMGLIIVGVTWAALVVGCASEPTRVVGAEPADVSSYDSSCREAISRIAGEENGPVAKKSPQKRGK